MPRLLRESRAHVSLGGAARSRSGVGVGLGGGQTLRRPPDGHRVVAAAGGCQVTLRHLQLPRRRRRAPLGVCRRVGGQLDRLRRGRLCRIDGEHRLQARLGLVSRAQPVHLGLRHLVAPRLRLRLLLGFARLFDAPRLLRLLLIPPRLTRPLLHGRLGRRHRVELTTLSKARLIRVSSRPVQPLPVQDLPGVH